VNLAGTRVLGRPRHIPRLIAPPGSTEGHAVGNGWVEGFHGLAFGLVDGLITMLGVVIGVAQATGNPKLVLVSGLVAGVANAFGNSIGFYGSELAERGEHMLEGREPSSMTEVRRSSLLSFFTSLGATLVLMTPFLAFSQSFAFAMALAVVFGAVLLFSLGLLVGRLWRRHPLRYGLIYLVLGVAGAGLSFFVGDLVRTLFSSTG